MWMPRTGCDRPNDSDDRTERGRLAFPEMAESAERLNGLHEPNLAFDAQWNGYRKNPITWLGNG